MFTFLGNITITIQILYCMSIGRMYQRVGTYGFSKC